MTLYEIDASLMALVDEETGEILDREAFDALVMERDTKIENVGLWIKNENAMAEALKKEIEGLTARKKTAENRVKRLKDYLLYALQGEKFSTSKVKISYTSSTATKFEDESAFIAWAKENHPDLLRVKDPEIAKTEVKAALNAGEKLPGASLEKNTSVIIK
mgnify:CR=1 FL=1